MGHYSIHFSPTGGTRRVADILVEGLQGDYQQIDLCHEIDNINLNEADKDMPDVLFDSVSDAIKEVMGCEAQQTKQKSRKCIMKAWETPAMTLGSYIHTDLKIISE